MKRETLEGFIGMASMLFSQTIASDHLGLICGTWKYKNMKEKVSVAYFSMTKARRTNK